MSESAIKKLRRKFIVVSMVTLASTMFLIAGFIYLGNTLLNRQIVQNTLDYIIENNGELIKWNENKKKKDINQYIRFLEEIFTTNSGYQSPEFKFTTRYFSVLFDADGNVTDIKNGHITDVTDDEAKSYAQQALQKNHKFGRIHNYYYKVQYNEDGSSIVVYMDSGNIFRANERLLYLALVLIAVGMIIAFLIVRVLSYKAIQNEIKNAELQKQFMTNISHELKTPLAVIRANTEMQEILSEENEWSQSTMRQIDRMNGLIQNLVMITRADEKRIHTDAEDVDITNSIRETIGNFKSLAIQDKKKLTENISEGVHMRAEDSQVRQLCSLLVDNAIKYCDDNGEIAVSLIQKGRGILLTVSNTYAQGENVDYTKFFERFYREDESHNVDKGGYGIGLSIAESLARQYHGNINVSWKKGIISFACHLKNV